MKLTKKVQYGLLFTTYLTRNTFDNLHSAAIALGISANFLEQVARQLRIAGIVSVKRGPGGGYEMNPEVNTTVGDVIRALGSVDYLTNEDIAAISSTVGSASLDLVNVLFKTATASVLNTPIKSIAFPIDKALKESTTQYEKTN